ncbi:hypothetical protein, conserved [Babesia ovata]|uniref:C3H1-type domain-containing protein n=2 Tax=Babesia ovata TaxID=189622 RepID=A0A2H6KAD6_9APIC|nr:uncharacterized protein BOVATA_014430 [Babesia ovata]GBE59950.1 hypothetical protein, conserved [Babesia ovata]
MSFLHGVLESVKDDENVTTYDKNNDPNIDKVISDLHDSVGKGREAFGGAVSKVSEWLNRHGEQVEEKIKKVTGPLSVLKNDIETHKDNIDADSVHDLTYLVRQWTNRANGYIGKVTEAQIALKNVDPLLSGKLKCSVSSVLQATENFLWSARNDDLQVLHAVAYDKIMKVLDEVRREFDKSKSKLRNYLNEHIAGLNKKLTDLRDGKFTSLVGAVKYDLQQAFESVNKGIEALEKNYKGKIVEGLAPIVRDAQALKAEVIAEKKKLNGQVSDLEQRIVEIKEADVELKKALQKSELDTFEQQGSDDAWNLKIQVTGLKTQIQNNVKGYVTNGLGDKIRKELEKLTDQIARQDLASGNPGHLENIDSGVKDYAKTFEATFQGAVYDMVDMIVNSGVADDFIDCYVADNQGNFNGGGMDDETKKRNAVKEAIRAKLPDVIQQAIPEAIDMAKFYVDLELSSLGKKFGTFASELNKIIKTRQRHSDTIVSQVKSDSPFSSTSEDRYLTSAVTIVLKSLTAIVSKTAEEIKSLIDKSKIGTLTNAIEAVKVLGNQLKQAVEANTGQNLGKQIQDEVGNKAVEVNEQVTKLLKSTAEKAFIKLQTKVTHIVTSNLTPIKEALTELQTRMGDTDVETGAKNGKSPLEKIAKALENQIQLFLTNNVGQTRDIPKTVYNDLKTLQTNIENLGVQVTAVTNNVVEVETELNGCIKKATRLLNFAPKIADTIMNELQNNANSRITEGFTDVQKEAERRYTNTKRTEIQALQTIVSTQLDEIENIITLDSMTGIKGLMNLMETQHEMIFDILIKYEFKDAAERVRNYFNKILLYTSSQSHSPHVDRLKQQLDTLLTNLKNSHRDKQYHFDHTFTADLAALNDALSLLTPQKFHGHKHPELLDALASGAKRLADELGKQYVNRYSGLKWSEQADADKDKCAKVLLTLLTTLDTSLGTLRKYSNSSWKPDNINKETSFGQFFSDNGFKVSEKDKKQWELQDDKKKMTGENVYRNLDKTVQQDSAHLQWCEPDKHKKAYNFNLMDIMTCLAGHLNQYNQVYHIATFASKRHPCSVYDMLVWFDGLPHNRVYGPLLQHVRTYFPKPKGKEKEDDYTMFSDNELILEAHPDTFTAKNVLSALQRIPSRSHNLLTTIVGTGDAQTVFASDFGNNSLNLHYPSNAAACFDMFMDMLRRVFHVLKFVHKQCKLSTKHYGWSGCSYGRDVPTTKSQCNKQSSENAKCQPNSKPTCQAKCQATCEPTCQPTSPLMSYLNDCLPGHLPHQLKSVGCGVKCLTCTPNSKGTHCITPLGFRAFSGSTRTAQQLCKLLDELFGKYGVLKNLVPMLTCLVARPPQTFPDIFSFYYKLIRMWVQMTQHRNTSYSIQNDVCNAIEKTISCKYEDARDFMNGCLWLYEHPSHFDDHASHASDLSHLVGCSQPNCGGFVKPLSFLPYSLFAPAHANKYFSWLFYSAESLVKYIENFKNAFCDISCSDSGCGECLNEADCQQGRHGSKPCGCESILQCRGVLCVMYQYGLTYADEAYKSRKKCFYLRQALENILTSEALKQFLTAIDKLMFCVRKNFIWTLLALWSLSLLYLLHIAVVRLDVLRIRSHLRSPSSHRIAAQSLLAAARVKALANVKHGNGGEGLKNLAEALKKLIEEAIKNATESLEKRRKELECADKGSSNLYDKHCNDLKEKIKKAKGDEKSKLQSQYNGHYSEVHSSESKREGAKKDLNERKKSLDKLKEDLEKFIGTKDGENPATKLLENLTEGLEKFLGFNSESKGYSGEGIVYSDLDRLCDGVMSFLLQCLRGSEPLLKHYYDGIDTTISKLRDAIGKGSGVPGFAQAIGIVQRGLQGYESVFSTRTEDVKTQLSSLSDTISRLNNEFNNMHNSKLVSQLDKIKPQAQYYLLKAEAADEAREKLDTTLKGKLDKHVSLVVQAVKSFKDVAENPNVRSQAQVVDEGLKEKQRSILQSIDNQSRNLQNTLNSGFMGIKKNVQTLYSKKEQQFKLLRNAVKAAKDDVDRLLGKDGNDFDDNYKHIIAGHFDSIRESVENLYSQLDLNKRVLDGLVQKAKVQFREIQTDVGKKNAGLQATIYQEWDALKEKMKGFVDGLTRKNGGNSSLQDVVDGILKYAKGFGEEAFEKDVLSTWVREIGEEEGGAVYNNIYQYVRQNYNKGKLDAIKGGNTPKAKAVQEAITSTLPDLIASEIQIVADKYLKGAKIETIAEKFKRFADNVGSEIFSDGSSLGVAVQVIGLHLGMSQHALMPLSDDKHLTAAVKGIAMSIVNNISRLSTELKSFIEKSKIKTNLQTAIDNVKDIGNQFTDGDNGDDSNTDHGAKIDAALQKVSAAITQLEGLLGKMADDGGAIQEKIKEIETNLGELNNIWKDEQDGRIKKKQKDAEDLMLELQDEIKKLQSEIGAIGESVETADEELNRAIISLEDALEKARQSASQSLSLLRTTLLAKVSSAFATLTSQVQSLFARQKQAELTQLQGVVTAQLREIKKIIHDDSINGVKGFLARLNEGFDETLQITTLNSNTKLDGLASNVRLFLYPLLQYVIAQITPNVRPQPPTADPHATKVTDIQTKLNTLLSNLSSEQSTKKYRFDDQFSRDLDALKASVGALNADKFGDGKHPELLNIVKEGVTSFDTQLEYAYVNKYSGLSFSGDMLIDIITSEAKTTELTDEGRNAAKAFFTLLNVLYEDMATLKERCEDATKYGWKDKKICKTQKGTGNSLGAFFERCGYRIPSEDNGKQDAELQCKESISSTFIVTTLAGYQVSRSIKRPLMETLHSLFDYAEKYNEVCHYSTLSATKLPCSIFEILVWMSGLPHHPVFTDMRDVAVTDLFEDPKKKTKEVIDGVEMEVTDMSTVAIRALPHDITYNHTQAAVTHMCSQAYDLLVCILGTGDAETIYGVDFCTNSLKLKYPNRGADCLQMFLEILRRLLPTLRYLEHMCSYPASIGGWSQCRYGKDVKPAKWPCDKHPKPEPRGQPKGQATDQPNSEPMCQPKSPLQSYLNDCLPGHLPHRLESVGCKAECKTCPTSQRGSPCVTPLGFKTFSGSMRRGRDICDVLAKLLDDVHLRSLLCLVTKPPASLPEHFQFTLALVNGWHNDSKYVKDVIQTNIENSAKEVSIHLYNETSKLTDALRNAYRNKHTTYGEKNHLPAYADVSSLAMPSACIDRNQEVYCAPYLSSLYRDYYICMPFKNSNTYLSWAIYLPWTFWDLLNNLYNAFCGINCQDWGCRGCLRGDKCRSGKHGLTDEKSACNCSSVVECKGVAPTLYSYGFTFGHASKLNAAVSVTEI